MARVEADRSPGAPFPQALPALTSVRFILALGVVLFHYQLQWSWDVAAHTGLLERARLGVDVFFILSGFVLTHAYRDALAQGRMHYGRFLVARLARIYPAHVAVLAFVGVMVGAAYAMGEQFDARLYNPLGLLATLFLVHAWFPGGFVAEWNGPSWSLSAEWFAYLAFPLYGWLGLRLRSRPGLLLALAAILFVALDCVYQWAFGEILPHAEHRMGILRILPEFLYGVALYRLGERLAPSRRLAGVAALATAAIVVVLMHLQADDRWIVVAAGPLLLALALLTKAGADAQVSRPWMLVGGEASYALYLVHMPVLIGWKGVVSALTARPSAYILAPWEVAILLPLTLAVALAIHYLIEAPSRDRIRRLADRIWPAPAAKAAAPPGSQPPDV